ncbi:MAG: NAD(P)H-dependent oxidoreductase [Lachnospiraceae bacterium]|nr:NAD(P)H-dependent oxidoreductase [Lachnospiraceae bacterium]
MILYINACVREKSRTKSIADAYLSKKNEPVTEVKLENAELPVTDEAYLRKRDDLIANGRFSDGMFTLARQFAEADSIVIATPYWDLSFPAALKQYFEHINVRGITFEYTPEGYPRGLCKAKELCYITTAGGNYCPEEFGYGYIKALAHNFYGIEHIRQIKATGLDIAGADAEKILKDVMDKELYDRME